MALIPYRGDRRGPYSAPRNRQIYVFGFDEPVDRIRGREHLERGRYIYDEAFNPLELRQWIPDMTALVPSRDPNHPLWSRDYDLATQSDEINQQMAEVDRMERNHAARTAAMTRGGRGGRSARSRYNRRRKQAAIAGGDDVTNDQGVGGPRIIDWYGIVKEMTGQHPLPRDQQGFTLPGRRQAGPLVPFDMNVPVDPYGYPIIPPPLPRQVPQNQYYALPAPPPAPAHMQLVPYQQLRLEHYVDPAHPPVLPMVSQGSDGRVVAIGVAGPPNPTEEEAARAARMQQLIDELNATHQAQGYLQSRLQGTAYQPAQSVRDDGTHSDSHMHTRRGSREAAAYPPPSQSFSSNSSAPFSQRPVGSGIPSLRHTRTMPELRYDTDPLPQGRWGHDFGSLSASIASIAEEDEEATPTMAPAMLASVRGAVSEQPRRRSAERDAPTTPTPRGRMGRGHRRRASSDVERERKGGVQL